MTMRNKLGPYLLGPNDENRGVYLGDAKELTKEIPDESVDLIFADPVYNKVDDYAWLAETATRILKPDSSCLVWCSNIKQYQVHSVMIEHLKFIMPLIYTCLGKTYRLIGYNIFVWSTPCLWFAKGKGRAIKRTIDTVSSGNRSNAGHKWNKNPEAYSRWINDFTNEGDIVFDPFTGSGTVPVVCKGLHRKWLAFEIEPSTVLDAWERIKTAAIPLPRLNVEQAQLFDGSGRKSFQLPNRNVIQQDA